MYCIRYHTCYVILFWVNNSCFIMTIVDIGIMSTTPKPEWRNEYKWVLYAYLLIST